MKKNILVIALVLAALLIGTLLGGYGVVGASASAQETFQQAPLANALSATIKGMSYTFEMTEAKVDSFSGYIKAKYVAYNPRGEKAYTITLTLPGDVAPGKYSSANGDKALNIIMSDGVKTRAAFAGNVIMPGQGEYVMTLDSRSADWLTYQGSFSAMVTMSNGGDAVEISNANFAFTLSH